MSARIADEDPPAPIDSRSQLGPRWRVPLIVQIGMAVLIGAFLGKHFGKVPYWPGGPIGNAQLGELTSLLTRLLKALAAPLVFFAVLDAYLRTDISWRRIRKMFMYSLFNVSMAMIIGLTLMNLFQPGQAWRVHIANSLGTSVPHVQPSNAAPGKLSSSLVSNLAQCIPEHLLQPFLQGNLLAIIGLALMMGAAYRALQREGELPTELPVLEKLVEACYQIFIRMLAWVVRLVPLAVLGAVAQSVAETGADIFQLAGIYLLAMLGGLTVHAWGYYTLAAWIAGKPPHVFLGRGWHAILTGLSTNSSLATVPVTLETLTKRMGVSDESARLSACVGTNFNNDGITLYEAMTAIFLSQAVGMPVTLMGQLEIVLICVIASLGAAGIPQGGLAVLPLVLAAAGLDARVIAVAMPVILTVDWIIARYRSSVNVMGDMVVAIQLDQSRQRGAG